MIGISAKITRIVMIGIPAPMTPVLMEIAPIRKKSAMIKIPVLTITAIAENAIIPPWIAMSQMIVTSAPSTAKNALIYQNATIGIPAPKISAIASVFATIWTSATTKTHAPSTDVDDMVSAIIAL